MPTSLQLATMALLTAAALSAVALSRRAASSPGQGSCHRPIAGYLLTIAAVDVLRWGCTLLLPPATGPREGWQLLVRHAEQGLYLAAILALPAMAWAVFLPGDLQEVPGHDVPNTPRASWSVAIVWLALWLIVVTDYPELSGPGLLEVYRLTEVAAVLFSGLCFAGWLSSPALLTEGPSASVLCALALISGPSASLALPAVGLGTLDGWPAVVAANGVAVGITLVLQLWGLSRGRRRLCSG